ncbi:SMAD/FHA domain-containing protein [Lichtheimia hyalospora FSU 10163]|nr:SMAD/FHA domain-containing protein [Lichtheimia hyalospora FSU 10163]
MPSSPARRSRSPRQRQRRSRSPPRYRRRDSQSPQARSRRSRDSRSPSPRRPHQNAPRRRGHSPSKRSRQKYEWGRPEDREPEKKEPEKPAEEPNFGLSGKLAAETNTVKGVELKYNEPPEAAKPTLKWRLYVFKGSEQIDLLHIHRQSSFLIGRDRLVADIPVDHPSCSKQHAVLQFRRVPESNPDTGKTQEVVKPFLIDLDSTNGTYLNNEQIPGTRYVELRPKDMVQFGHSTREYVLLHSSS